jgi:hypothetical protein
MTFMTARKGVAAAGVLALLLLAGTGYAQRDDEETIKGKVKAYTEAPKGEPDGVELDDGTVVHWPPHLGERFAAVATKGDRIEVTGRRETLKKGEKVFEARSVTNLRTRVSFTNDDDRPPPPPKGKKGKKDKDRVAGPDRTVTGKVKAFTEAPKGETDGMELDDGTVAHWPPHLERHFTAIVKKGDRVRVVGWDETLKKGEKVLEVRSVTNLATKQTRINEDAPPAPAQARGSGDDVEKRLRALEDKFDQLLDEVKQLRRKK